MTQPLPANVPRSLKTLHPDEIARIVQRDPRLIVPIGTSDPHGPHLPYGTDTIIVEHLADDFSAELGILRAPTIEYGVNVDVTHGAPGSTSLRKKTLHRFLNDLVDGWERAGIAEFILLTAHESDPHLEAMSTVITTNARLRAVDVLGVDLSDLLEGQSEPMHADEVDTSLMLHLAPGLVAMDRAQDYMLSRDELRRYRRGWLRVPRGSAGSIGRPSLASAEKGAAIYDRIKARLRERVFEVPVDRKAAGSEPAGTTESEPAA